MVGRVTILANSDCPHCIHATDAVTAWCCEEGVPVAGVDLRQHPEAALRYSAEHSPVVVVEREEGPRVVLGLPTHADFLRLVR